MKVRGGYNVALAGRPSREVEVLPEVDTLYLPLESRRFRFTELAVREGERVRPGQALARDPGRYAAPLLAPRAGTVRLEAVKGHLVLERVERVPEEPAHPEEDAPHADARRGSVGARRYRLLALGAWQFFQEAHTGALPDPFGTPAAVIVSTLRLEPFVARGDVQLAKRVMAFIRGLEHLQTLLEYQPIYLVLPDVRTTFAAEVRDRLRGYAWVQMVSVPRVYGREHNAILARALGHKRAAEKPVWATTVAGVLAVDRALTRGRPSTVRIVSLGGPGVTRAVHVKAIPGYPLDALLLGRVKGVEGGALRLVNGGALTGRPVTPHERGLDVECEGLTVLLDTAEREFLGFMRPGFDRRSYSGCFLSAVRGARPERLTTSLRGERRACVGCSFCEEVCPARLIPHLIHKALYQGQVEAAERLRVDLCVDCGLCAYVCPSKIELPTQFAQARAKIAAGLAEEVGG
jgi:Na(+)-translocating NADH:ubiquinone oxidoreductase A subunit